MAIHKAVHAALKVLSYPDINLKKNYKVVRRIINITHPHYTRPFYKAWNHKVFFEDHEIPVRIFSAEKEVKKPILLFFHGGGWVTGNINSYNKVCAYMAKLTKHTVVSVDYRLAPEYRFPAAPEDCYYVAKEIFLHSEKLFGIKQDQITLIGDSAGGNLAAVVSLMARDRGEFLPKKQILIYPSTNNDFTENTPFPSVIENGTDYILTRKKLCDYMELYQSSEEDRKNPYFAPMLAENLYHQPSTLVITAEFDPLRDEGEAYAKRLSEYGNEVRLHRVIDGVHGFFSLTPRWSMILECYDWINKFLSEESNEE